jgi:hypothetical protein
MRKHIDDFAAIEIDHLRKGGQLEPQSSFDLIWRHAGMQAIGVSGSVTGDAIAISWLADRGGGPCNVEVWVDLCHTRCHFGGSRIWFQCPRCHSRCGKLYLALDRLLCRHCVGAAYRCQSETQADRARRLARRVRRRLGASTNLAVPITDKPKGMHWRKFDVLTEQCRIAEAVAVADIARRMNRLGGI